MTEKAMEQVTDEQLVEALDSEGNSIAMLVKHMAGNMRSRWTGFPEADGEKPDRHRDTEFEDPPQSRAPCWQCGERVGIACLQPLNRSRTPISDGKR